jgi:hypothetical protein
VMGAPWVVRVGPPAGGPGAERVCLEQESQGVCAAGRARTEVGTMARQARRSPRRLARAAPCPRPRQRVHAIRRARVVPLARAAWSRRAAHLDPRAEEEARDEPGSRAGMDRHASPGEPIRPRLAAQRVPRGHRSPVPLPGLASRRWVVRHPAGSGSRAGDLGHGVARRAWVVSGQGRRAAPRACAGQADGEAAAETSPRHRRRGHQPVLPARGASFPPADPTAQAVRAPRLPLPAGVRARVPHQTYP